MKRRAPTPDRRPKPENRFGAKHFLAAFLALGGVGLVVDHLKSDASEKPDTELPDTGRDDVGDARRIVRIEKGQSASDESPEHNNLPPEEQARADAHASIKHAAADRLIRSLPEGFTVQWVSAVIPEGGEEQPQYNENIIIVGPDGHNYGDVYPYEDGLHFVPNDDLSRFYQDMTGSQLGVFDFTDPNEIVSAVGDVESLEDYREAWSEFEDSWPSEDRFVTDQNGSMHLNPDYESKQQALRGEMRDNLEGLEVTTTSVQQERVEEEEQARQEELEEQEDTGW